MATEARYCNRVKPDGERCPLPLVVVGGKVKCRVCELLWMPSSDAYRVGEGEAVHVSGLNYDEREQARDDAVERWDEHRTQASGWEYTDGGTNPDGYQPLALRATVEEAARQVTVAVDIRVRDGHEVTDAECLFAVRNLLARFTQYPTPVPTSVVVHIDEERERNGDAWREQARGRVGHTRREVRATLARLIPDGGILFYDRMSMLLAIYTSGTLGIVLGRDGVYSVIKTSGGSGRTSVNVTITGISRGAAWPTPTWSPSGSTPADQVAEVAETAVDDED